MTVHALVTSSVGWALSRAWTAMDDNAFTIVQWLITLSTPLVFVVSTLARTRCCRRRGAAAVTAATDPSFWSFLWGPVGVSVIVFLTMTYVVTPFNNEWEAAHRDVAKAIHDLDANCRTNPHQPFLADGCDKTIAIANARPFWLAWEKRSTAMANWIVGLVVVGIVLALVVVGQKARLVTRFRDARALKQHQALTHFHDGKSFQ